MKNTDKKALIIDYTIPAVSLFQRIMFVVVFVVAFTIVFYIFYHTLIISMVLSLIICPLFYKRFLVASIQKRRRSLRLQFRELLESLSVSIRAGNNETKALRVALNDLKLTFSEESDIIVEVTHIINSYENGVSLRSLFEDFGERSGVEDIKSFSQIFNAVDGKSNRFGDIVRQTHQIISDKIEIEEEIKTTITSSQSEQNIMFVLPVVIMLVMSTMGGSFMNVLFESVMGKVYVTIAVILFIAAFFVAQKITDIKV